MSNFSYQTRKFVASVPLKVILFGEYSVLEGGRGISVAIKKYGKLFYCDSFSDGKIRVIDSKEKKYYFSIPYLEDEYEILLECMLGSGLGTSAVISLLSSTATVISNMRGGGPIGGLLEGTEERTEVRTEVRTERRDDGQFILQSILQPTSQSSSHYSPIPPYYSPTLTRYTPDGILKLAHIIEDTFHGRSSGLDVATCYKGGMISYRATTIRRGETGESYTPNHAAHQYSPPLPSFSAYIHPSITTGPQSTHQSQSTRQGGLAALPTTFMFDYKLVIWDSLIQKSTYKATRNTRNPEIIEKLKNITEEAYKMFREGFDLEVFYKLVRRNQDLFVEMGICPEKMKEEVEEMRKIGIECKITGSGNGGHLVTIIRKEERLKREGWEEVEVDYSGLVIQEE